MVKDKTRKPGDSKPNSIQPVNTDDGIRWRLKEIKKQHDGRDGTGVFGASLYQAVPSFRAMESETVFDTAGKSNCGIVMGPFRPGGPMGKRMARGDSHTATIDLVAGRLGSYRATVKKGSGNAPPHAGESGDDEKKSEEMVIADNNYKVDSARVVISEKGDPDEEFGVRPGKVGTVRARAFVAAKADYILLSAREGIKLVTGTDDENSFGQPIEPRGIDLIAGNDDSNLQPIPKGTNLVECIEDINDNIGSLNGIVLDFILQQMLFNAAVLGHTHIVPGPLIAASVAAAVWGAPIPVPTFPDPSLIAPYMQTATQTFGVTYNSIMSNRINLKRNYFLYLNPKPGREDKYICSKKNNTN